MISLFFSILIPAHNEENNIEITCAEIVKEFEKDDINDYEILMINDNSTDNTEEAMKRLSFCYDNVRYLNNKHQKGYGFSVRYGLENFSGECVCIVMADLSDSPKDILKYYRLMKEGNECVFGSRFINGSKVYNYPIFKLILNRWANLFIKSIFLIDHNDITNAFKCYSREVIEGIKPLVSNHYNLSVEMPLKAIVRGYRYVKVPISWANRKTGISKLKINEMGSRYLFVILYVFMEKLFSKGDYYRLAKGKR